MPPQLPCHIIQSEVLPRLPAKSLGRFRCVCKSWNSALSTPTFARMQLRYQTNYKLLLLGKPSRTTFSTQDCDYNSITTRPNPFKEPMFILASLDGLVCVALEHTRELAFWNPLTGAYKKFKTSFYDDVCENTAFGLYIDSSNDYKLVHIVSEGVFVYSLRLDSWTKINTSLDDISHHRPNVRWSLATFLEEKVYFKMGSRGRHVISFDVESEKFNEVQLPPFLEENCRVNLVALNGCIHLCVGYRVKSPKGFKCDMWRMDGDGWMKAGVFTRSHCLRLWYRQIYTKRNGDLLAIVKDYDGISNSIKNIDLEDLATDYDYYHPFGYQWYCERIGAVYIETLVSPNP